MAYVVLNHPSKLKVLTSLCLIYMFLVEKALYSFKNSALSNGNRRLKTVAVRTFIGSVCTLISSIVAIVIHWITSRDSTTSISIHDDTLPGSDPRSQHKVETELSAIPPRTPRHRLSSIATDTTIPEATTKKARRSHITLSTENMVSATTHHDHDHDDASTAHRPSTSTSDARITREQRQQQ
ncbi:hypothetical protein N0V88_000516 [Collariella sp. IMI 366227]|nr:hypothetical protein N0V88_000516 [Collariella sp. IMI 366227]